MTEATGNGGEARTAGDRVTRAIDRRRFLAATTGAAGTASLAGCLDTYGSVLGSTDEAEPITIGLLAPDRSRDMIGRSMYRSAQLAVDELNDDEGIDGREVELAVANTKSSPLEARRQYQRLVLEEDADVTVGVFASEALMGIIDDIAEQELLHLTTGAATTEVSGLVHEQYDDYKYHFRVGPNNDVDLGRMQIDFLDDMADEIGWDSVALLAEDYDWTENPWEVYQNEIEGTGVEIAMEERYPPSINDFGSRYDEAEEAGADAVFITTAHTGTDALLQWAAPQRELAFGGIHVPMQLPAYYDMVGGYCRYAVGQTSATATSEITDLTQEFVGAYQNAYGGSNPVYTGYHTYDAVKLFAHAVEQEGTVDSDVLVTALEEAEFEGSAGTVDFYDQDSAFTHDLRYHEGESVYFQWQENEDGEGVQEVVWPSEEATAEYVTPSWLE